MRFFFESTPASIPDDPGEIVTDVALALDPRAVRTAALELAHDVLIATVQVIDVVEPGGPVAAEGGDDERRAGSDVGDGGRAAMQRAALCPARATALGGGIGPELAQLG